MFEVDLFVSIPNRDNVVLQPPALRTLTIFSFQGAFARPPFHYNRNLHSHDIKIPQTLNTYSARAIDPPKTAQNH